MKIALITDTHAGFKNDSLLFHDYFVKFYNEVFFPELKKREITTIIHGGDLTDRRRYINFNILYRTRVDFFEKLVNGGYNVHIILGNHDTTFRDTSEVNSVREICSHYPNFHIYEDTQEVTIDGRNMLFVPWLNLTNMDKGLKMIEESSSELLIGHLEIAGFHMDQVQICEHGMERETFAKFKMVLSGHFHHKSKKGVIQYLGAPYEMTFADMNDPKGFHILDTETLELEFIPNPNRMFYRLVYDDRDESKHGEMLTTNFSQYEGKFVRMIVSYKTNPILYDKWVDRLAHNNPADLQISEKFSLGVSGEVDEQFVEFDENQEVVLEDTLTILNSYVDAITMEINKDKLKDLFKELYVEAVSLSGEVV